MANDFVRNIKGVRNINKVSPNIITENDLISTVDNDVYVVTNDGYKKITGNNDNNDNNDNGNITELENQLNSFQQDLTSANENNHFIQQKQNEKSFMNFLKENSVPTSNNTISLTGDRNIDLVINLSEKDNVKMNFKKDYNDDFIKFRTLDYEVKGVSGEPTVINEDFTESMVSNSLNGGKGNYYTTNVGTKINFTFKGTDIYMTYYTDNRGGIWKASIDDTFVKNISTHNNAQKENDLIGGTTYKTLIKDNMEDKEHTLTLEFIGEDEQNPTDTPRGWIKKNNDDDNYTFTYTTSETGDKPVTTNALYDSNKEFAFDISYNNTREWVPEHNATGTLKLSNNGSQKLFIDGEAYAINERLSETKFDEVKILQNLYGINSKNDDEVCHILLVTTITSQGVKFNTKLTWLKELTVNSGYVNMFTVNPQLANSLTTSYGNNHDLNIYDNSYVYLEENAPYSFVALSDKFNDFYLTCDNINGYDTLRLGYDDRDGNKYGNGLFAIQHRNENLQKLYPKTYDNHTTKQGEVYEFEGFYGYGKLPMVNDLLK